MQIARYCLWFLLIASVACPCRVDAQESASRPMTIVIVDEHGEPMEGVNFRAGIWRKNPFPGGNPEAVTDETGLVEFELPDDMYILRLWVWADGYTRLFANWEETAIKTGDGPPDRFTFRMMPGATIVQLAGPF